MGSFLYNRNISTPCPGRLKQLINPMMKCMVLYLLILIASCSGNGHTDRVAIEKTGEGFKLVVNNTDFMVNGMNWDYFPIGTNYSYRLWDQPEDLIKEALDTEMVLLKAIGVNAVRQYTEVPPKWIQYIYEKHGIYTMLNHSFGRYGLNIDGVDIPKTDYSDSATQNYLLSEIESMVLEYRDTPGLLMYLLGNENNFGLFWEGAETEDIPEKDPEIIADAQAMYTLFNQAALKIKSLDNTVPVAMCNGDLQFLDIIANTCADIDIFGTNMYRGESFGDAFERVSKELDKPLIFTEFGSDAYNAIEQREDQISQAHYVIHNWKEIYENAAGLGKTGNSIGGFTFQFTDGWWKFGQTENLYDHDNNASWSNGGYEFDYQTGSNNMNEEWFGVCSKGPTNNRGLYKAHPRAAYYVLQEIHQLNPYSSGIDLQDIHKHFNEIEIDEAVLKAQRNGM